MTFKLKNEHKVKCSIATKTYDSLNQLQSISSVTKSYTYEYNDHDQRTKCTLADGSYWLYQYDELGQVTSDRKYKSDDSPIPGQDFGYNFDDIGNRKSTTINGSNSTYTSNDLNQYSQRTAPNTFTINGSAAQNATVKITRQSSNDTKTPTRNGIYFSQSYTIDNSQAPSSDTFKVFALKNNAYDKQNVNVKIPKSPEAYPYDHDGNLLTDGQYTYKWNAENRLIEICTTEGTEDTEKKKLEFVYDYQGRRTIKKIYSYDTNTSAYVLDKTLIFVYDGWNEIARFEDNTLTKTYTWGEDLSGSLQGAGGVGGLLAVNDTTNTYLPCFDGNGNVMSYLKATDGIEVASYEYSPFGRTISQSGSDADNFDYKFSTKPMDKETELYYYIYRYYDPEVGRWLSRDGIGEEVNGEYFNLLYGFVENSTIDKWDYLGKWLEGGHKKFTKNAYDEVMPESNYKAPFKKVLPIIKDMIVDGNLATDKEPLVNKLEYHYNRPIVDKPDSNVTIWINKYSEKQKEIYKTLTTYRDKPALEYSDCEKAYDILGQLTHMWQDYYAHGIAMDSDGSKGTIGRYSGSPTSPTMKPSSWGGMLNTGEHGGFWSLINPWSHVEPGGRAKDADARRAASERYTVMGFTFMLEPLWEKCKCPIYEEKF